MAEETPLTVNKATILAFAKETDTVKLNANIQKLLSKTPMSVISGSALDKQDEQDEVYHAFLRQNNPKQGTAFRGNDSSAAAAASPEFTKFFYNLVTEMTEGVENDFSDF